MADRSGLRLVGLIFATVTFAVMLTTTMVVKIRWRSKAGRAGVRCVTYLRGPHTSCQLLLHFLAAASLERDFPHRRQTRQKGSEDAIFAQSPEIEDHQTHHAQAVCVGEIRLRLTQCQLRPSALGQIEHERDVLVPLFVERRIADQHGHTATI